MRRIFNGTIMKKRYAYLQTFVAALLLLCGCTEKMPWDDGEDNEENVIRVGVETAGLATSVDIEPTRATNDIRDAEKVEWLIQPLKKGLDITYGQVGKPSTERVAILKLLGGTLDDLDYDMDANSGYACYSFNYRAEDGAETSEKARWYGNGPYYFKGVHVPNRIRFTDDPSELESDRNNYNGVETVAAVHNLTTNQSDDRKTGTDNDLGSYTLLSHYLGMPANTQISATVARIKLPFRHRLAHVLAYILIDPELETKIKGYDIVKDGEGQVTSPDDPNTSAIKFCYVDVLKGVKDVVDPVTQLHTLTPVWAEKVRKVTPHFWGEVANMEVYKSEKGYVYPKSANYAAVVANPTGYTKLAYTDVPVYDLIVRPTYTSKETVMYDEEGYADNETREALAAKVNQIVFSITLENGLAYEKNFEFDLDANYETIVYLHITRQGVNYSEAGAEVWQETTHSDNWYGIDNKNGHTLSQAGSSWQRAYTRRNDKYINDRGDKVTDGGFYDEGTNLDGDDDATGQYLSAPTWIKYFSEAHAGGAHHGDYFNLSLDIEVDARLLPDEFVFTGHLDAFGEDDWAYHTITLTHTGVRWKEYIETTDYALDSLYTEKPADKFSDEETTRYVMPTLYRQTDEAELYTEENSMEIDGLRYDLEDVVVNPSDPAVYIPREGAVPVELGGVKTPAVYEEVSLTLAELMAGDETFYTREAETYTPYLRPERFYRIVQHTSPTALFAGLNGIYSTRQEDEEPYSGLWEANVHKEGANWLPYVDAESRTGWRAEVMNLTVKGARLFAPDADITGNVQNCKDGEYGTDAVQDHVPAMPKY